MLDLNEALEELGYGQLYARSVDYIAQREIAKEALARDTPWRETNLATRRFRQNLPYSLERRREYRNRPEVKTRAKEKRTEPAYQEHRRELDRIRWASQSETQAEKKRAARRARWVPKERALRGPDGLTDKQRAQHGKS